MFNYKFQSASTIVIYVKSLAKKENKKNIKDYLFFFTIFYKRIPTLLQNGTYYLHFTISKFIVHKPFYFANNKNRVTHNTVYLYL